jgi:hypothetical protein
MPSKRSRFIGPALVALVSTAAYFTIIGIFEMTVAVVSLALYLGVVLAVWRSGPSAADGGTR